MQRRSSSGHRRRAFGAFGAFGASGALACALAAGMLLAAGVTSTAPVAVGASGRPAVELVAPAHVALGQRFTVGLRATNGAAVAGFSADLRFDGRAVDVATDRTSQALPGGRGGALQQLGVIETPDREVVAGWSCTGAACARGAVATTSVVPLASLLLEPLRDGVAQLRLDDVVLVDAAGRPLAPVAATTTTVVIGRGGLRFDAPAGATSVAAPSAHLAPDSNGDGHVGIDDVVALEPLWDATMRADTACASTASSCVTIADLQRAASQVSVAPAASRTRSTTTAAGAAPVTFTVNSAGDAPDARADGSCQTATAGVCTLRAAIQEANRAAGPVMIAFAIAGSGVHTIAPCSLLPALNNPNGGITIDGFTQPGASPNTAPLADNASYGIELKGQGPRGIDGITVLSAGNTIRGLDLHGFKLDISLYGTGANSNTVVGDMVGLEPDGNLDPTQTLFGASSCVVMQHGASSNQIGAPGDANRNVVSGCNHIGIATYDWPTKNNVFQNNIAGLDPTGTQRRASESHGVDINTGTQRTLVGGTGVQQGNVLSGNAQEGVEISHNPLTTNNSVVGNLIGTDLTGNAAPAYARNGQWGVHLEGYPNCGTSACPLDEGFETVTNNIIVDSGHGGLMIDKGVHDSVVAFNKLGVTLNGTAAGNALFGVNINAGSVRNTIGPYNEIANNASGIQLESDGVEPADPASMLTNQDTFTSNLIHDNGVGGAAALGIDLAPFGTVNTAGNSDPNVNDAMLPPALSSPQAGSIDATTCAGCTVEVFLADRGAGQVGSGRVYLGAATADSAGAAHVPLPLGAQGNVVTATATNAAGSTSEYSSNVTIPMGTAALTTYAVGWTTAEQWRLEQIAAYLHTTPELLEHDAVGAIAFILGIAGVTSPTPDPLPPMGTDATVTATWLTSDVPAVTAMQTQFAEPTPADAHRACVYILFFIMGLTGH